MALAPGLRSSVRIVEPGQTSVGTSAVIEHKRPSPLGAEVVVEAELTEVDGRRLVFSFMARHKRLPGSSDDSVIVGAGTLERVIVDRDRFASRAQHE
jgi:fluoroacetyl-CoA thioesterase